jgi:hypothetical protein
MMWPWPSLQASRTLTELRLTRQTKVSILEIFSIKGFSHDFHPFVKYPVK